MSIGESGRIAPIDAVHSRQFDDELLLLDLGTGYYFSLNPVGTRMYAGLTSGKTPTEIAEDLAPEYGIDVATLVRDCIALADDLLQHGLVKAGE